MMGYQLRFDNRRFVHLLNAVAVLFAIELAVVAQEEPVPKAKRQSSPPPGIVNEAPVPRFWITEVYRGGRLQRRWLRVNGFVDGRRTDVLRWAYHDLHFLHHPYVDHPHLRSMLPQRKPNVPPPKP